MKHLRQNLLLALWLTGAAGALGAETNAPARPANAPAAGPARRTDFDSFKLITDRNIFNGNRSGQRVVTRSSSQRPTRVDSFTLVGTMSSERGDLAFFDGSESNFRKTLKRESQIAGFVVKEIWPAGVKLVEGTNEIALRVGTALRREDEGYWRYAEPGNYSSTSGKWTSSSSGYQAGSSDQNSDRSSSAAPGGSGRSEAAAPAGNTDEILRKLMEKREKENQ